MAEDSVRKYLDAKAELDRAKQKVSDIAKLIAEVGDALKRDPWSLMVSNVDVGFPPEVAMGGSRSLNADNWPTARQIAELLSTMHKARHGAVNAWASLSKSDRENLTPPEGAR